MPLKRSTKPIKRTGQVKRKRTGRPRRVSVVRDQKYMDWLKTQRCVVCTTVFGLVFGRGWENHGRGIIDPAHTLNNGHRSKGPDSSCIPLCRHHHDEMDGRLSTLITTKGAFAAKYGLDLAAIAASHYAAFQSL
jgi:hypothetical protein